MCTARRGSSGLSVAPPRATSCSRSVASHRMPRGARGSSESAWSPAPRRSRGADPSDESVRASVAPLSSITDLSREAPPFATDVTGGTGTGTAPIRAQAKMTLPSPVPADIPAPRDRRAEVPSPHECTPRGNESWLRRTGTCTFRAVCRGDQETHRNTFQDEPLSSDPRSRGSCPIASPFLGYKLFSSGQNGDAGLLATTIA